MRVRVEVDPTRCIGCGLCEENLPSVFSIGDFTAEVQSEVVESSEELIATAADCPTEAIVVARVSEVDDAIS